MTGGVSGIGKRVFSIDAVGKGDGKGVCGDVAVVSSGLTRPDGKGRIWGRRLADGKIVLVLVLVLMWCWENSFSLVVEAQIRSKGSGLGAGHGNLQPISLYPA